jgi:hypothetical protein
VWEFLNKKPNVQDGKELVSTKIDFFRKEKEEGEGEAEEVFLVSSHRRRVALRLYVEN